jgi:uncharacterized protein YicC (UPF0701 family)
MTDKQVEALERIVEEIQADTPEANVTASSIARYALEKYIQDYMDKKHLEKIFIEICLYTVTKEELTKLYSLLSDLHKKVSEEEEDGSNVTFMLGIILHKIMSALMHKYFMNSKLKNEGE